MALPAPHVTTSWAPRGMVASVDRLASGVGLHLLRLGGTAVDAAIGTNAVLAVVAPHLCGMGGDLFALVHDGPGPPAVLNASGRAGSGASAADLRDDGHDRMPRRNDVRSVTVPGCVDGWLALHARYGRLPLDRVLSPAADLAAEGYPASPALAVMAAVVRDAAGAEPWVRSALSEGDIVRRPGSAAILRGVVGDGRRAFYGGDFGAGLLALGGGLFTAADFDEPAAEWVTPLRAEVWGEVLWTVPPNSQGYLVLAAAEAAAAIGLPADTVDAAWPHALIEIAREVGHDRPAVLHESADGDGLRRSRAARAVAVGVDPRARVPRPPHPTAGGDTTYIAAVDGGGMAVSLIQSNAADFGSHLVEPTTGTFLHNRGIGFSLDPGHPAELAPGRRPPHTLSPVLVTRPDGTVRGVVGTMGGDAQPQIVFQLLARWLGAAASPGDAVSAPRWVLGASAGTGFDLWTSGEDVVRVEGHAPSSWRRGLAARGHRVEVDDPYLGGFGHAHLIEAAAGPACAGAADPRALVGAALGF